MDTVGKIDLKEQLKSLFDTGINLNICQIGAIQWAINQVAISKTETTSCEWCKSFDRFEFNPIDHDGNCIPDEYCMVQSGLAAYCPNCGRKIKEEQP